MQENNISIDFGELIQRKLLYTLDFTKSHTVQSLILFLHNLQITEANLVIIKKLIEAYGLPIIIYLKTFYEKMQAMQEVSSKISKQQNEDSEEHDDQQTFVERQKQKLQHLSLLAKQVSLNIQILYINFMHKYGTSNKNLKKKIKIGKQDEAFIKFIKSLQDKKQQIVQHAKNNTQMSNDQIQKLVSEYNQYYEHNVQQSDKFDQMMLHALQHIKKSHNLQSELDSIIQTQQFKTEASANVSGENKAEDKNLLGGQSKALTQIQKEIKQNFILDKNQLQKNQNHTLMIDSLDNLATQQIYPLLNSLVESNSSLYSSLVPADQSILNDTMTADFYSETENFPKKQNQFLSALVDEKHNFKKYKADQLTLSVKPAKPLCCRTFFFENQVIVKSHLQQFLPSKPQTDHSKIPQNNIYLSVDSSIQFEDEKFPFTDQALEIFENQICGFLNGVGGIIFIGISKSKSNSEQYVVKGLDMNEGQKQTISKHFRVISSKIEPDIVTHKQYSVDFVPLKKASSNNFIAGAFVVKIKIKYGNRDEVYCIKNKDSFYDKFVFRQNNSQNQIIEGRRLLDIVRDRYENPIPVPGLLHTGACERPEIGLVINEYYNDQWNTKQNNSYENNTYDSYYENKGRKYFKEKTETQLHAKIISQAHKKNLSPEKPFVNSSPKKAAVVHYEKPETGHINEKPNFFNVPEIEPIVKNTNPSSQAYFYVVGLNEKMLKPVLQQKGVKNAIIQQAEQNLKLVVKAFDDESISKVRKILKRIQSKYENRNIRYYQLSLTIQVLKFKEAIALLKNFTCKYDADERNRVLKFHFFKDSLTSWLYLKEYGIQGDFIKQASVLQND